tara:strand:- start:3193 stop:3297 length:105 start_codon:yes stop_codon:yes gene_type:complete
VEQVWLAMVLLAQIELFVHFFSSGGRHWHLPQKD